VNNKLQRRRGVKTPSYHTHKRGGFLLLSTRKIDNKNKINKKMPYHE
jgi:hypothetical protein